MHICAREEGEGGKTNLCEGRGRGIGIDKYVQKMRGSGRDKFVRGGGGKGKRQIIAREEKTFGIDTLTTSPEKLKRNLTF